jgi:oligoendopeptidase F
MNRPENAPPTAEALPTWDLGDLYAGMESPAFARDVEAALAGAAAFEARYKGRFGGFLETDPDSLGGAVEEYEAIEERIGRIMSFAGLLHAGDLANGAYAKFHGDAQEKMTAASSHLLFVTLELNRIDEDLLAAAYAKSPRLAHYRPWLDDLRKDKPYQLEDRVEQLFHEKSVTGTSAWNRLFDETLASLRFRIGAEELAIEPALNLLQDQDRAKRVAAQAEIGRVLAGHSRLFALVTNTLAKDKQIADDWRGFATPAAARHLSNRVEPEVVASLVGAVRAAYPRLSHRYYRLKARWLDLAKLGPHDRNAPLPSFGERRFSWDEARRTVLGAYGGFSAEMADIAGRFFASNWIDAPVRPGKASGAFAHPTVPSAHPYVLVNFQGRPRDVMTLAHELGHGVHQVLAADKGALMSQTPLTLAETASVFGEMLTFRAMLAAATNAGERKAMLARKIEDMINTVVRQVAFYTFEERVHAERRSGELTADRLGEIWMEVQRESLGDAFEFDDAYRHWWSYIPHFVHSPFYVYAYAFGDCLVNSLFAVYRKAPEGFVERYFAMLKAGGTMHHSQLLAPFGINAADPAFWNEGLALISSLIDEVEAME